MGTAAVILILCGIITLIIKNMIKTKRQGKSVICGGDCKHCGGHCAQLNDMNLKEK